MQTTTINYKASGLDAVGYLAVPDGDEVRGGVLVCHEGPGQDDHVRGRVERIADELGYVAFALDYHGGAAILGADEYIGRLMELGGNPTELLSIANAGLAVLRDQPMVDSGRLAAVGYCFGGTMALELARSGADLKAVVGLHSGLQTAQPGTADKIQGQVLVAIGTDDPFISADDRAAFEQEMQDGGVDFAMEVFDGVGHSFTNRAADDWGFPGIAFDQKADASSWELMKSVLSDRIG